MPENSKQPAPQYPSEAEYKHLISFFDHLVKLSSGFILGLLALAGFLFYKNLSDAKTEARTAVEATKQSAQNQIDKIKEDALAVARAEAQKRVDEQFNTGNISQMVEAAAERKIERVTDRQIEQRIGQHLQVLQKQISETAEIADLGMRMRIGFRDAWEHLQKKVPQLSSEQSRQTAKSVLNSISSDYESAWQRNNQRQGMTSLQGLNRWGSAPTNIVEVVKLIRMDDDLNRVAVAFLALREMTGQKFQMFDFNAVDKWCSTNPGKC